VPAGHEKKVRFVTDLTTSRAVPEAEFGKEWDTTPRRPPCPAARLAAVNHFETNATDT